MTLARPGQRTAGEHADTDDTDPSCPSMVEQPPIILCRIIRRQFGGRGRIEHIVDHLSAVEGACVDHLMQRHRVTDCRKSKETRLALLPQPLERGRHGIEYLSDT